jgi:hypothetical protein
MAMNQVLPEGTDGVPVTKNLKPEIVVNTLVVNLNRLELHDQKDQLIAYQAVPAENNIHILTPETDLEPGRYCWFIPSIPIRVRISIGACWWKKSNSHILNIFSGASHRT